MPFKLPRLRKEVLINATAFVLFVQSMKILSILFFCLLALSCAESNTKKSKPDLTIGDDVVVRTISGSPVAAAKSRESLERLVKAKVSKDEDRYNNLLAAGEVVIVADNTKAKITDYKDIAFEIKLLDGESEGQYVWVGSDWLKPLTIK